MAAAWIDRVERDSAPNRAHLAAAHAALAPRLFPYQREAVDWARARGGRILLAHEMGRGRRGQILGRVWVGRSRQKRIAARPRRRCGSRRGRDVETDRGAAATSTGITARP